MKTEEFKELNKEIRSKGLVMGRVPSTCRDDFVEFATQEFAGDYGMCFREVWEGYKRSVVMYDSFDIKLNAIIRLLESKEQVSDQQKKEIKLLSGKKIVSEKKALEGENSEKGGKLNE